MRIPVCIKSMRDTKHLVQAAGSCEKDVDLICGRYVSKERESPPL